MFSCLTLDKNSYELYIPYTQMIHNRFETNFWLLKSNCTKILVSVNVVYGTGVIYNIP